MFWICSLITLGFAIARFIVPVEGKIAHEDIFKDAAHLWVGFLFGAAAFNREKWPYRTLLTGEKLDNLNRSYRFWWWVLPVGLTAVEVLAFFVRKG